MTHFHFKRRAVLLSGVLLAGLSMLPAAKAATDIKFTLDWKFEAPSAPFFIAIDKGYFAAEGLNVTVDISFSIGVVRSEGSNPMLKNIGLILQEISIGRVWHNAEGLTERDSNE